MRYLNNIATVLFAAALGQAVLTSCEGGDLYNVDSPDWIASRVDSIAAEKQKNQSSDEIVGLNEDVYTIGATDYTSGWWAQFSKDYPIMENEMWVAQFNLNINPSASNTYKNFALIITSDAHRGDAGYKEYGAIRFDHQPSGNSEWGDYINRDLVESSLTFGSDTDAGVDKLGGKVTLYIDRSVPGKFGVKMTNGNVTKTYIQNYEFENLNDDPSNTTIRAFLVVEGSYINFIGSTLEPIGGYTSAEDKQPLSMELKNMPKKILLGTSIDDAFANLGALVNFETGVSKEVKKEDLTFSIIPDMETVGQKQIIVAYNKTFKGENCDKPVLLAVNFEVVDKMYEQLQKVNDGLVYEFSVNNEDGSRKDFVISADCNPELIPVVEKLYDARPNLPGWNIQKYRSRMESFDIQVGDAFIDSETARFCLVEDEDNPGMVDVLLFIDDYSDENIEQQDIAASVFVSAALGEYDVMKYVDLIEALGRESAFHEQSQPISELAGSFDEWKTKHS